MRAEMAVTNVRLPSRRRAGRPAFAAGERQHQAANPAMRETQLLITYRGSPIVADLCSDANPEAPAPGDRLPDVRGLAQRFVGHARRLHDFVGSGRHTLIGYVDAAGQQYDAFLTVVAHLLRRCPAPRRRCWYLRPQFFGARYQLRAVDAEHTSGGLQSNRVIHAGARETMVG